MEQDRLRAVLQRAEEIQIQQSVELHARGETNQLIEAAVEAGLSREAVEQALRERIAIEHQSLQPGELVFAPSGDGFLYAAKVVSLEEGVAVVRFLSGSDIRLLQSELRPFALLPGQKVSAPWPDWGWWTCQVVRFDREHYQVRLSDGWGSEHSFPISEIRLAIPRPGSIRDRIEAYAAHAAFALGGGAIGALLTWLLLRR